MRLLFMLILLCLGESQAGNPVTPKEHEAKEQETTYKHLKKPAANAAGFINGLEHFKVKLDKEVMVTSISEALEIMRKHAFPKHEGPGGVINFDVRGNRNAPKKEHKITLPKGTTSYTAMVDLICAQTKHQWTITLPRKNAPCLVIEPTS